MNLTTSAIGLAMICYGLYSAYARVVRPGSCWKLQPMIQIWGPRWGYWIHVGGYTVLPLVLGVYCAYFGLRGQA